MTTRRSIAAVLLLAATTASCDVLGPDADPQTFDVLGHGVMTDRFTSDMWVRGDWAYTGTWGATNNQRDFGNTLNVWDVSDPTSPRLARSLQVDARVVNDVKVSADGSLAVITHELSNDGLNGVTLLDLADPSKPVELARYTDGLTTGVHNTWIDGDHLYVVVDGIGQGLRILDISDPTAPEAIASFYAGDSFLHDVHVRDGLAFLSHWDAGLIILDVGNGIAGGSPSNPVEVSRLEVGISTHNAWYWPDAGYVFVGQETSNGLVSVLDVSDLANPSVVATFDVPPAIASTHNFWVDEDREILYAAWYTHGVRAVDVSGELSGSLDEQGRELAGTAFEDLPAGGYCGDVSACTWAPQLQNGRLFVSDLNHGLLVLQPVVDGSRP